MNNEKYAPGAPGITPRWTTSSKDGVGTAVNLASNVSFTLSHGILNEIYYPRIDKAATRDMGMLITNGKDFFGEEKRHTETSTEPIEPGIPAYHITNTCTEGRYSLSKEIITDPLRNVLMQRIEFKALKPDDYHLYALLAPHLDNQGADNSARLADYKGMPVIYARNNDVVLAFVCSVPWKQRSVGFAGVSDGWQELNKNKKLVRTYDRAESGNVAVIGEVDLEKVGDEKFEIAIGFGSTEEEAAHRAISSITESFETVKTHYIKEWAEWHHRIKTPGRKNSAEAAMYKLSASVLRIHQAKAFPGAMIAGLCVPWGDEKGDDSHNGYHLVWPRDMVQTAGGLLALQAENDVLRALNYLMSTQEEEGHWAQNMWLEGKSFWEGIQLDETALPVLLIDICLHHDTLDEELLREYRKTMYKAIGFLLRNGPVSEQERWEEQEGISVYSLAVCVAAFLSGAHLAEKTGDKKIADYCRRSADMWNELIDTCLYAENTRLSQEIGTDGYYLRINPTDRPAAELGEATMLIKNKPDGENIMPVTEMVSIDPLALVRFGLRAPDDPRILNTVKVIDAKLKAETPNGDSWYRYVNDGYGEHPDGRGYDGTGIGRPWPLLTGERAHYEVAAGNLKRAKELKKAMENFANNGMMPEQIWDTEDIPERGLFHGEHSGAAMPLAWAHAEYIKLTHSIKNKKIFDMPAHTQKRYLRDKVQSDRTLWRPELRSKKLPKGRFLRIETVTPAFVKWTFDEWESYTESDTQDMGLGVHYIDLPTDKLQSGRVIFTYYQYDREAWTGENYVLEIV